MAEPKVKSIKDIFNEKDELLKRLAELNEFIEAYQKVCDHDWKDNGRDSHYSYKKCVICDKEERV